MLSSAYTWFFIFCLSGQVRSGLSYYNWTVCGIYPVALPNNKFRMP